jgi:hypothetical protein
VNRRMLVEPTAVEAKIFQPADAMSIIGWAMSFANIVDYPQRRRCYSRFELYDRVSLLSAS